jgi:hypothetical protein
MTVVLPETIEHLDFHHEPGCQFVETTLADKPCGRTPVGFRITGACEHTPPMLCCPCAVEMSLWLARSAMDGGTPFCLTCGEIQPNIRVVPL